MTLCSLLVTAWLIRHFDRPILDLCQAAVALSAWYGGFGPGVLAAAICAFALDFFFVPPYFTFTPGVDDLVRLIVFAFVALVISSLTAILKKKQVDLEQSRDELEERVRQRTQELSQVNIDLKQEITYRLRAEKEILEISNREKQCLGQDLHDGLCQILAGIRLMSEDLKTRLSARAAPEATDMEWLELRLDEALAQADMVSRGLYPVELDTNGLMAALQELATKMSKIYSVECRFICKTPVLTPDSTVANHLYRIAQEAVMNAVKDGKAKKIHVRLSEQRDTRLLMIADNGVGFDAGTQHNGMGLKIMNYRARIINATLRFRSRPKGGTVVQCVLPKEIF